MNDLSTLEIENYLSGEMNADEKKSFEDRLSADPVFNAEFILYRDINESMLKSAAFKEQEAALKNTLAGLTKQYFKPEQVLRATSTVVIPMNRSVRLKRLSLAFAAAIALVIVGYWSFRSTTDVSPNELAVAFVSTHLNTLSQTMSVEADSLQQGIAAYNKKDYGTALSYFNGLYQSDPNNAEALKNAGLSYMVSGQYDAAIQAFDTLSAMKLYSNAGPFLKAVTLLQRNAPGDSDKAKSLLEQVVAEKQEKSDIAAEWLKTWQ